MRRLLLVFVVGLLCATSSGVFELIVPEPCTTSEKAGPEGDGSCPPTCLRCHCARPFDVVAPQRLADVPLERIEWTEPPTMVAIHTPDDILHVPRPALA